jgi:hypothetical protein
MDKDAYYDFFCLNGGEDLFPSINAIISYKVGKYCTKSSSPERVCRHLLQWFTVPSLD